MKQWLIVGGFILYLALASALAEWVAPSEPPAAPPAHVFPQEDEPGWDCRTMGNLECGPSYILAP